MYIEMLHHLTEKADHTYVGAGLVLAGFLPNFVNLNNLQTLYFLFLIPPAAYHCWSWFRKAVLPGLKKLFDIPRF